jgi:hypothetical protein
MAQIEGNFEKGASDGAEDSLRLVTLVASRLLADGMNVNDPAKEGLSDG